MQERLYIRLPASDAAAEHAGQDSTKDSAENSAQGKVVWFIWNASQHEVIASGELNHPDELNQLQQQARRCETTLVLPGQDVLLKQLELPAGSRRHLERVIPYALEEELATDIDDLHFSWPANVSKSTAVIPVAVVARERMRSWSAWCQQAGIEADHWLPEPLLLPYSENHWSALSIADALVVRTGPWQGFTLEQTQVDDVLPMVVAQLLGDAPELTAITHFGEVNWPQPPAPLQAADIEVPISALAQGQQSLELRRGEFAVKRKRQHQLHWKPLAVAASVAFVLAVGGNLVRAYQLSGQAEQLQTQAEQLFLEAFPNKTRIVNLRAQLQQELRALGADGAEQQSALALLDSLQPAFASQRGMSLELMRYQDGELRLQALAQSFAQFEQFQRAAEQAGLSVQQGALNNRGNQVAGSITIQHSSAGGA